LGTQIIGDPKCDHCHKKSPVFTEVKLFGKKWLLCPECGSALGVLFSRRVAEIVGGREYLLQDLKDMAEGH